MRDLRCTIIGDVNIDIITTMTQEDILCMENPCVYSHIISSVGGNGIFFSEAAKEAGFASVKLVCAFGQDLAAKEITDYCQRRNLTLMPFPSPKKTGKAIILYKPDDKRILIADRGANEDLLISPDDLPSEIFYSSDILYISGYHLLNDNQSQAVESLAKKFIDAGVFTVLDTVPHDIYEKLSWNDYLKRCAYADGIIIEGTTVAGFMGIKQGAVSAGDAADFLLKSFGFCIIRLNAASDFLIADRSHRTEIRINYRQQMSSLRFSDRVTAFVLKQYFTDPQALFASSKWVESVNQIIGEQE